MKSLPDHRLKLRAIKVKYLDGSTAGATAEGNNASWNCECGALLVGRCYLQFGHRRHTRCWTCGKTYWVAGDTEEGDRGGRERRINPDRPCRSPARSVSCNHLTIPACLRTLRCSPLPPASSTSSRSVGAPAQLLTRPLKLGHRTAA
jgi:hypothetical protein